MNNFRWNRIIAWTSLALGAGTGLIMGMWSFDGPATVPSWLGNYGDTSRRLARLGHIAFFGIGILNLLMVRELGRLHLGPAALKTALVAMNIGNVFLPLSLFAAAGFRPLKYFMSVPATAVFVALLVVTIAVWREKEGTPNGDP